MQTETLRLQSFFNPDCVWPHPTDDWLANPVAFAQAGFYHNPDAPGSDKVTCFLCHKSMDGWVETDDPDQEHAVHSAGCVWAKLRLQQPLTEQECLVTFGEGWWPHDGKRRWKCTSKKLALAGFAYMPTEESDDMVKCSHCGLGLDGWEAGDDPVVEHRKRAPNCQFFQRKSSSSTGKKKTVSRKRTASTSDAVADTTVQMTEIKPAPAPRKRGRKAASPAPADVSIIANDTVLDTTEMHSDVSSVSESSIRSSRRIRDRSNQSTILSGSELSETEQSIMVEEKPKKTKRTKGKGRAEPDETMILDDEILAVPLLPELDDLLPPVTEEKPKKKGRPPKAKKGSASQPETAVENTKHDIPETATKTEVDTEKSARTTKRGRTKKQPQKPSSSDETKASKDSLQKQKEKDEIANPAQKPRRVRGRPKAQDTAGEPTVSEAAGESITELLPESDENNGKQGEQSPDEPVPPINEPVLVEMSALEKFTVEQALKRLQDEELARLKEMNDLAIQEFEKCYKKNIELLMSSVEIV